ncbi:MAG TPA: tetratricopeptide repeat protein, partial [Candidatus Polarisedimenticolia bacterium]|nr:tetratricopeptide repeat protein [Candidatus Polarisedimenticolia bacterium]
LPQMSGARRAELMALRGALMQRGGDHEGAERLWKDALRLDPIEPHARLGLAAARLAASDPVGAARLLERVDHSGCRIQLAKTRLRLGDPKGAMTALTGLDPARAEAESLDAGAGRLIPLYRGRALLALKDPAGAIDQLRLYFDEDSSDPRPAETSIEAATDLAAAYQALGKTGEAIGQYRIIAGLADSLAAWNFRQAREAADAGDLPKAVALLGAALEWNPRDAEGRRLLARTLMRLGRGPEALAAWRALDQQLQGDAESLQHIAGLSLSMQRPNDAAAAYRRWKTIESDPVVLEKLEAVIMKLDGGT